MIDAKFTPGPWFISEYEDDESRHVIASEDRCLFVAFTIGGLGDEQDANARLIAAAPELLVALQSFLHEFGDKTNSATVNKAREAIAKATA